MVSHIMLSPEVIIRRSNPGSPQRNLSKKVVLFVGALLTVAAWAETCPQINEIHFNMPERSKPGMFITATGWTSSPIVGWTWLCDGENCYQEPEYPRYIKKFAGATFSVIKKEGAKFVKKLESCNYVASHDSDNIVLGVTISMKPPDSRFLTVVPHNEKMWRPATYICDQSIDVCQFDLKKPVLPSPVRRANPFAR